MNGAAQTALRIDPTAAIRAIWNSNRDEVMGRVAVLEEAVAATIEGRLSPADRGAAEREAHKLAGAAGTFGFRRASEAARKLEGILQERTVFRWTGPSSRLTKWWHSGVTSAGTRRRLRNLRWNGP